MPKLRTIQDYYELIYSEYPTIPKLDIKRILLYGWKSFYRHNSYGGDTLFYRNGFWFYCGHLMKDSLRWFEYYKKKMGIRLRVMFKRKNIPWNGYYYFALSLNQYNEYLSKKNKRGRPRKNFIFTKIVLYKIYDECNVLESSKVALFKVPMFADLGLSLFKEKLVTDKAELILVRKPFKFHDILRTVYNYQFISDCLNNHKKEKNG